MYTLTKQDKRLVVLDLKGTGLESDKDSALKKRKYSMPNFKDFFKSKKGNKAKRNASEKKNNNQA